MVTYRLSVPELWHRIYEIEADSFEDAVKKYRAAPYNFVPLDQPEYIDDIEEGEIIQVDYDYLGLDKALYEGEHDL